MGPGAAITYVGHSTVLLEIDGLRILTDPLLRPRVAHLRRITSVPRVSDLLPLDAVVVSHAHHDHLDPASLRLLGRSTPIVAASACVPLLRRRGFERVIGVLAGQSARFGPVEVRAVPAMHDGRRYPLGKKRASNGFLVTGSGGTVYFAGDTDVFRGMEDLGREVDIALLPVWGWGPRVPAGHMDPKGAAEAAALIRPPVAMPIHWGTYAAPRVPWVDDPSAPANEFRSLARDLVPATRVRVLSPGERWLVRQ